MGAYLEGNIRSLRQAYLFKYIKYVFKIKHLLMRIIWLKGKEIMVQRKGLIIGAKSLSRRECKSTIVYLEKCFLSG